MSGRIFQGSRMSAARAARRRWCLCFLWAGSCLRPGLHDHRADPGVVEGWRAMAKRKGKRRLDGAQRRPKPARPAWEEANVETRADETSAGEATKSRASSFEPRVLDRTVIALPLIK